MTLQPYSAFDEGPSRKAKANKGEKDFAKRHGGKRQPCSGAFPGLKGDIKFEDLLVDLKETEKASFRVTVADLQKIVNEALGAGKSPALVIRFHNVKNFDQEWAVIPVSVLKGED